MSSRCATAAATSPGSPTASSTRCASRCPIMGHECRCGVSVGIAYQRGAQGRRQAPADRRRYRALSRQAPRPQSPRVLHRGAAGRDRLDQADGRRHPRRASSRASSSPGTSRSSTPGRSQISGVEALARWEHPTPRHRPARHLPADRRRPQRRRHHRPHDPRADPGLDAGLARPGPRSCRAPRSTSRPAACATRT